MISLIIFFAIALLGLILVFAFKMRHMKTGASVYPKGFMDSMDSSATYLRNHIGEHMTDMDSQKMHRATKAIKDSVVRTTQGVYQKINNGDSKMSRFIKGERTLARGNKRSDFLEDIEKHKRDTQGGEIDWNA